MENTYIYAIERLEIEHLGRSYDVHFLCYRIIGYFCTWEEAHAFVKEHEDILSEKDILNGEGGPSRFRIKEIKRLN